MQARGRLLGIQFLMSCMEKHLCVRTALSSSVLLAPGTEVLGRRGHLRPRKSLFLMAVIQLLSVCASHPYVQSLSELSW